MRATAAGRLGHLAGCGWFWAWALVGGGFGFAVSVMGIVTVPAATLVAILLSRRSIRGAFGIATGVGLVLLLVAYINRGGQSFADGGAPSPVHWLIPGLVLFTGGILAHAWQEAK
jgi:lipopolysaccharide export LptBFGC system permease protein LptF